MIDRLALIAPLDEGWIGGHNYVASLAERCAILAPQSEVMLFGPWSSAHDAYEHVLRHDNVRYVPLSDLRRLRTAMGLSEVMVRGQVRSIANEFRNYGVRRIFSPTLYLGRGMPYEVVYWIPDFQHLTFPDHFSLATRTLRDISYLACAKVASKVILSSSQALSQYEGFVGGRGGPGVIVPFVPTLKIVSPVVVEKVLESYGLGSPFCYLPNQFWLHKNHRTALRAFLSDEAKEFPLLVLTGGVPSHLAASTFSRELESIISEGEAVGRIRHLGSVPRDHVTALMQSADVILNPSLFEGRSTTVEEALALGVPLAVSDIPVHREQAEGRAAFFDATNEESLRNAVSAVIPGESRIRDSLDDRFLDRMKRFDEAVDRALLGSPHVGSA